MGFRSFSTVLKSSRASFLLLTPACIALGVATAYQEGFPFESQSILLVLVCALAAHISVNTFNEYFDFKSGLDFKTDRSPFNGGSGALIENPGASSYILMVAVVSFCISMFIGGFFVYEFGLPALFIGILGLATILAYTHWINRHPIVCLIAPGFCFGPLMVIGTHLVLTGSLQEAPILLSLVPFFLVNNLLLINQIPDREADKQFGRNHFSIAYGPNLSRWVYGAFSCFSIGLVLAYGLVGLFSSSILIALIPLSISIIVFIKFNSRDEQALKTKALTPLMAMNTFSVLVSLLVMSPAILFA